MIIIKVRTNDNVTSAEVAINGENRTVQNEFRCAVQGAVKGLMSQIPPIYEEQLKSDLKRILKECIDDI